MRMWRKIVNFSSRIKDVFNTVFGWHYSVITVEADASTLQNPKRNRLGRLFMVIVITLLLGMQQGVKQTEAAPTTDVDGVQTHYYDNGVIESIGPYINGIKHGEFYEYSEEGFLRWIGPYRRGVRHGEFKEYSDLGDLTWLRTYKNGELHGTVKKWYETGDVAVEWNFEEGKPAGIAKEFYFNRPEMIAREWDFTGAECDGVVKTREYDREGHLILAKRYKDNTLIDVQRVDEGGCQVNFDEGSAQ